MIFTSQITFICMCVCMFLCVCVCVNMCVEVKGCYQVTFLITLHLIFLKQGPSLNPGLISLARLPGW